MAVKGRFLATRAVYPRHNWFGRWNFLNASTVAFLSKALEDDEADFFTIWAFCLRTSAGVRMKQETSSPIQEAAEWIKGAGIRGAYEDPSLGLSLWRMAFVPS